MNIPRAEEEFHTWLQAARALINSDYVRLSVNIDTVGLINGNYLAYNDRFDKDRNPDTDTTTNRHEMWNFREALKANFRSAEKDMPVTALTESDRGILRIPLGDSTHTPIFPVNYSPTITVDKILPGSHTIRISDPTNPDTLAMPKGNRVEIQVFVGAANLPPASLLFANSKTTGRFLKKFSFTDSDKGKTAYYRARYYTKRGEGDWSATINAVVA